ncbi:MAG: hypothetical protein IJ034_00550, partial [Mailhella sp.]|nr:hypothetical protein [Mailhella sp.]
VARAAGQRIQALLDARRRACTGIQLERARRYVSLAREAAQSEDEDQLLLLALLMDAEYQRSLGMEQSLPQPRVMREAAEAEGRRKNRKRSRKERGDSSAEGEASSQNAAKNDAQANAQADAAPSRDDAQGDVQGAEQGEGRRRRPRRRGGRRHHSGEGQGEAPVQSGEGE